MLIDIKKNIKLFIVFIVLLAISIFASFKLYEYTVASASYSFTNLEIVEVEQLKAEGNTGELLVTVKNVGSSSYNRLPRLHVVLDNSDDRIFLEEVSYYTELEEAEQYFYINNYIPPGEQVQVVYEYTSYLNEGQISNLEAKIVMDVHASVHGEKEEYNFIFDSN